MPGVTSRSCRSLGGEEPAQRGQDRAIGPVHPGPGRGTAQHRDLVSQHQQLCVLKGRRAAEQDQPAAKPDEDQVEQAKGHGRSSCPTADRRCIDAAHRPGTLLAPHILTNEMITAAYHRLLERFGTREERTALEQHDPLRLPPEGVLMDRAVNKAGREPSADISDRLAALELAGRDQENAVSREARVVGHLRRQGVSWQTIAGHRGLRSAQAAPAAVPAADRTSPIDLCLPSR